MKDGDGYPDVTGHLNGWGVVVLGLSLALVAISGVVAVGLIAAWLAGNFAGWWWLVAPQ